MKKLPTLLLALLALCSAAGARKSNATTLPEDAALGAETNSRPVTTNACRR